MSDPYVGEIRMFGGNFAPHGWAFCDGSLVDISLNYELFSLLGTTYGGDGQATFALPDLRGRAPVHLGQGAGLSNYVIGATGGSETVTLTVDQIPPHTHTAQAQAEPGTQPDPKGGVWADSTLNQYSSNAANTTMNPLSILPAGGSLPHDNMLPYQCINFIIALEGLFPSQG